MERWKELKKDLHKLLRNTTAKGIFLVWKTFYRQKQYVQNRFL
jgi:hypothetical protein